MRSRSRVECTIFPSSPNGHIPDTGYLPTADGFGGDEWRSPPAQSRIIFRIPDSIWMAENVRFSETSPYLLILRSTKLITGQDGSWKCRLRKVKRSRIISHRYVFNLYGFQEGTGTPSPNIMSYWPIEILRRIIFKSVERESFETLHSQRFSFQIRYKNDLHCKYSIGISSYQLMSW